jgi:hypothetical protein
LGRIVSRKEAIKELGEKVYDAPLVALAEPGTEQDYHRIGYTRNSLLNFVLLPSMIALYCPTQNSLTANNSKALRNLTDKSSKMLQSVLNSVQKDQKQYPRRVVFARVGWMKYYAGPQTGDEKPIGGGENNKKNIGHELFNFIIFGGHLYGFVRAADRRINLERIDPTNKG